ncbi:Mammalian cell entry related domain protein [Verrucomicrobia bacterium]|nr:Mammalian cell entry related domain protein [Verrucomicrobiota bacterium]
MKNTLETRLGIFVALAVIAAVLILETVGGVEWFQRGYSLNALFTNVQDLKKGDPVKMAGVEIGRVEDIKLEATNDEVRVIMRLKGKADDTPVKTDSMATIKFTGLMGQYFVSLDFGTAGAPRVDPGAYLKTQEQPDFSAMMAKIDKVASGVEKLTASFTGDKIDNLLGPLTDFIKANRLPLTATIANLQAVSAQIRDGQGTVGKLIKDDTLYYAALATVSNFQDTASEIKLTVGDARRIVNDVNAGQGTVGKLLKDETLYRETTASMTNLKEILQKVNQGQGTVGKLINDPEFYKNAKLSLQKLDQATEGLEDEGPLSVLGLAVGRLF